MEVEVNTIYVGSYPSFNCGMATFTNNSIELTVQKIGVAEQNEEKLVIMKKDVIKAEACFQSSDPFFSLKLKYAASQKIWRKMGFGDQTNLNCAYDTKRKHSDSDVGWIVVFINLSSEFESFFLDFLSSTKIHGEEEVEKFFLDRKFLSPHFFLHKLGGFISEPKSNIIRTPGGVQVFSTQMEALLKLRKYVGYIASITSITEAEISPFLFSQWFMNPLIEKYTANLYCTNCGEDARLKCAWCKTARYCRLNFSKLNFFNLFEPKKWSLESWLI